MKHKHLLLSASLFTAIATTAQIAYEQDFEGADPLATMTTYGTDGATISTDSEVTTYGFEGDTFWVIHDAIGSNAAMTVTWFDPAVDADNYLITPAISLAGGTGYSLSWKAQSLGNSSFLDPYVVKLSTTGTAKADFTTTLFTNAAGAPNTGEDIEIVIPAEFSGDDIHIAFIANGNDDFVIAFDNIMVEELPDNDIELVSLDIDDVVPAGDVTIKGTVRNSGANTITAFEIDWNDGTAHPEDFTVTIEPGDTYDFEHGTTLSATGGEAYSLEVCASIESDEVADNNCLDKEVSAALDEATRLPLIELFTSSTCPPCKSLNYDLFDGDGLNAALDEENANDPDNAELAVIKYQVNWPGGGDHAFNADVQGRVTHYSVGGAPTPLLDATAIPFGSFNSTHTDAAKDVPAFFEITATHSSADGEVTVNVEIDPYMNVENATLHIALLDKEYEAGTGGSFTNGETEFHHVLRKMLPSSAGTTVSLTAGEAYSTSESYEYTFNASHPDQGSFELHAESTQEVVVFLQAEDNTILNAAISTGELASTEELELNGFEIKMFPNPASETTRVNVTLIETEPIQITVRNTLGEVVYTVANNDANAGINSFDIDLANFAAGIYTVQTTVGSSVKTEKLFVK